MKTTMLGAALAAVAMTAATPALARSERCARVTEAQIAGLFDQFNAAWATKNPDTVTDLFGPDSVLLATVAATPRTDRAGIRDYFVTFLQNSPVGTIETSTIDLGCNMATRVGTWTVRLTDPASGAVNNVRARYSFIYKFQNGRWVIDHLHSSVLPPNP
ncbi:MAG: SgcJ/EcaC family oxidoreductase [Sphingomonadaceae bacterium]